jgi:hypothetical protein
VLAGRRGDGADQVLRAETGLALLDPFLDSRLFFFPVRDGGVRRPRGRRAPGRSARSRERRSRPSPRTRRPGRRAGRRPRRSRFPVRVAGEREGRRPRRARARSCARRRSGGPDRRPGRRNAAVPRDAPAADARSASRPRIGPAGTGRPFRAPRAAGAPSRAVHDDGASWPRLPFCRSGLRCLHDTATDRDDVVAHGSRAVPSWRPRINRCSSVQALPARSARNADPSTYIGECDLLEHSRLKTKAPANHKTIVQPWFRSGRLSRVKA